MSLDSQVLSPKPQIVATESSSLEWGHCRSDRIISNYSPTISILPKDEILVSDFFETMPRLLQDYVSTT